MLPNSDMLYHPFTTIWRSSRMANVYTTLIYGLHSVASRPEFCQVASETFVETSILNCFSTRTHIPK